MMALSYRGIYILEVPNSEIQIIEKLWPSYLPPNGPLFLIYLLVHFGLFIGILTTWNTAPLKGRIYLSAWISLILVLSYMGWKAHYYFPSLNPLYFGWRIKCSALSVVSMIALIIANRNAKTIAESKQELQNIIASLSPEEVPTPHHVLQEHPELPDYEQQFLIQLSKEVKDNISNHALDCKFLADKLNTSEQTLRRRIHKTMELTPGVFIKNQRLMYAKALDDAGKVRSHKELAAAVGFKTPSYFMKVYRAYLQDLDMKAQA